MEPRTTLERILRTDAGRLRLGWRLLLFLVIAAGLWVGLALIAQESLVGQALAVLLGSVTAGAVLLTLDGRRPASLGFHLRREAVAESGLGIVVGTGVALAVAALMFALGGLDWSAQEGSAEGWLAGALGAMAFLAVPAAAEEALLRGYPLQALAEAWGPLAALALTSVAFGALHLWNPGVTVAGTLNVVMAGVFLGIVYLRTASLWWASGAHLGWNWAHGYAVDVPVSGLELLDAPLYEGVTRGPAWLGGGEFGPEGSLVATGVLVLAALWAWRTGFLRVGPAALEARPLAVVRRSAP
jgi:hypothetical protein